MAHRQIVLDTETTGLSPQQGHRIIEIGCIEMIDRKLTDNHFHCYINPQRSVDPGAFKVHGISDDFLADKPVFSDVVESFFDFVNGAELVIHNAPFDVGFINSEMKRHNKRFSKIEKHCNVTDTLAMARQKHPGQKNNLDALCRRYHIDNSDRTLHGALLDSQILALVYLAMTGGQTSLFDEKKSAGQAGKQAQEIKRIDAKLAEQLIVQPASKQEQQADQLYADFLDEA